MKLLRNIKALYGIQELPTIGLKRAQMDAFNSIENAYLILENGRIDSFGKMTDLTHSENSFDEIIDCTCRLVLPAYCDSHTHAVFATSREEEFVDRIHGLTYEEIALKGGGILNSAAKLANMPEDELFESALNRIQKLIRLGTGAIEIKSGYGLSVEAELKMLRVIKRLKETLPIPVKATFLGAHAFPKEFKENHEGYLDLVLNVMLPKIAEEGLADYIDVFCEKNYFDLEQTKRVMLAGSQFGLKSKIHVNQFNALGGIALADELNAVSVDHLEEMTPEDFAVLSQSSTIATALPSCSFFLGIPYAPVKEMIQKGITVALASDYNPGSTPSGNMNFVISLACSQQKLTPEQAFNAATLNGACAMEVQNEVGSITIGKRANLIITNPVKSLYYLPYSFGENCIDRVLINGDVYS